MTTTHSAKVLADSLNPAGFRLTTMEVTFPRIVLSEFNTHRALSRNSASSRAIPIEKMILRALTDPYIPSEWPANGKGMSADWNVSAIDADRARTEWLKARDSAVEHVRELLKLGIHKQITNRLLEPFLWHTVIVSATEWQNFFELRCAKDAHPEIRRVAEKMREALAASTPVEKRWGEWHLPLVPDEEKIDRPAVSAARCARVSYLTHDGRRDPEEDLKLFDRLVTSKHFSPLEHVAQAADTMRLIDRSNFDPPHRFSAWRQLRKDFEEVRVP